MPTPARIKIAKPDIVELLQDDSRRVYSHRDIERILAENRKDWRLAQSTTVNKFIEFLLEQTQLVQARFDFPGRPETRYAWGQVSLYEMVQSLKPSGYFTHYTAMHLHELTQQIPKTVYLNFEQKLRGGGGDLTQQTIDRAFKAKCRVSNRVAVYREHRICLLNGVNTGQHGVIDFQTSDETSVRLTGIERTLIDATVRPVYSGGVFEVARAFESARGRYSVNKLVATLRKLNYTYPYHQSIGFYLERADYSPAQVELLRRFEFKYDFYLVHQMKDADYNARWRLFVPKGF